MIIRTAQDATAANCCGCQPELCPGPRKECQSLTGLGYLHGEIDGSLPPAEWYNVLYKSVRREFAGGGHWYTYVWNTIIEARLGEKLVSTPMVRTDENGGPDTYNHPITDTYTGGVTFADAVPLIESMLTAAVNWDDATLTKGGICSSARIEKYQIFYTGGIRYSDFSLVFVRYRMGIPSEWADFTGRHATWVTEKATWDAADPDTRGTQPVEPTERSTYKLQWDEGFFPTAWTAWKALKDAFDAATAAHAAWVANPGDPPGPEPVVPANPGAAPSPAPSITASRIWNYTGGAEFSGWFVMPIPSGPGETRLVNMMVVCYRSARVGLKPTATGEVFVFGT